MILKDGRIAYFRFLKKMTKVSICVTVFNEKDSIVALIDSIMPQLKNHDEVILVDGGSNDGTKKILKKYDKKHDNLNVFYENASRAQGRNIAVGKANNEIVAMTDAGCVAQNDWLEKITKPFRQKNIDVVAGFYEMVAENDLQKAMANYLGVTEDEFDDDFLPSTRSIAFTKMAWKQAGKFPEQLDDTAEDTVFNLNIVRSNMKIARVKNARVEWRMPEDINGFIKKIYYYAKGDAKSGIWYHEQKKFASHNIKAALILSRYFLGFLLLMLSSEYSLLVTPLLIFILLYLFWSFDKNYSRSKSWRVGLWGMMLQIVSDLAVMTGFIFGSIDNIIFTND